MRQTAPYTILSDHDPSWESEFQKLGWVYFEILGDILIKIEHVGSTAINGIKAKPILDIDIVIEDNSVFPVVANKLKTIGYTHNGDQGIPGREAFLRDDQSVPWNQANQTWMKHHLYVCTKDSRELDRHIRFRDYLNSNSEAAKQYENIKLEIESRSNGDRKIYADIKENEGVCTEFIERVLMITAQKEYHRKLKYRFSLQIRTINRIIDICALPMGLVTRQEGDIINDYFYFCITKACKSLKAIKLLYENKYFEDSLSLLRSAYESYLKLRYMLYSKEDKRIDFLVLNPIRLNNKSYVYLAKENGKKDRNKIIDTGNNNIIDNKEFTIKYLAENTGYSEDENLHEIIYPFLCDYANVNMATVGSYFTDFKKESRFTCTSREEEDSKVLCLGIYFANLFLAEIMTFEDLDPSEVRISYRQLLRALKLIQEYSKLFLNKQDAEFYLLIIKKMEASIKKAKLENNDMITDLLRIEGMVK